jgi:hypothetical protein
LNDTLRANGIAIERNASFADMQKSVLDALKTRTRNAIRDLDKQIETGETPHREKVKVAYDDEAVALMAERDTLRRQLKDPTAKNKESLTTRIAEVERKLAEGDTARQVKASLRRYDDAEAATMRTKLKTLTAQLGDAQRKPDRLPRLKRTSPN